MLTVPITQPCVDIIMKVPATDKSQSPKRSSAVYDGWPPQPSKPSQQQQQQLQQQYKQHNDIHQQHMNPCSSTTTQNATVVGPSPFAVPSTPRALIADFSFFCLSETTNKPNPASSGSASVSKSHNLLPHSVSCSALADVHASSAGNTTPLEQTRMAFEMEFKRRTGQTQSGKSIAMPSTPEHLRPVTASQSLYFGHRAAQQAILIGRQKLKASPTQQQQQMQMQSDSSGAAHITVASLTACAKNSPVRSMHLLRCMTDTAMRRHSIAAEQPTAPRHSTSIAGVFEARPFVPLLTTRQTSGHSATQNEMDSISSHDVEGCASREAVIKSILSAALVKRASKVGKKRKKMTGKLFRNTATFSKPSPSFTPSSSCSSSLMHRRSRRHSHISGLKLNVSAMRLERQRQQLKQQKKQKNQPRRQRDENMETEEDHRSGGHGAINVLLLSSSSSSSSSSPLQSANDISVNTVKETHLSHGLYRSRQRHTRLDAPGTPPDTHIGKLGSGFVPNFFDAAAAAAAATPAPHHQHHQYYPSRSSV